jgi:putative nucleotidyltransferase with HDIG domain
MSRESIRDRLQKLASRLQSARQCRQIYPGKHPRMKQAIDELQAEFDQLLEDGPVRVAYADDEFVIDNTQIPATGEMLKEFASLLEKLGIEKLVFEPGIDRDEVDELLDILGRSSEEIAAAGGLDEIVEQHPMEHIEVGTITVDSGDLPEIDNLFRAWESYSAGLKIIRGLKSVARQSGDIRDMDSVRELAFDLTALAIQETRPLLAAHSLMQHDEYSFTHSLNVAMLTLALAQNLPFSPEDLREIAIAALLHDIGKERIPSEILNKPGKLTAEEWEIMNTHGLEGARMLSDADGIGDLAPLVAYEHHLAYHEDLRDDDWEPHLVSQLVSIADVYDALRSIRPYRGAIPPDEVMRMMEEDAGTKFEPSLFAGFKAMAGYYPPGTLLRLDSGRLAVAFASNPHTPELPQVVIVREADGSEPTERETMSLAAPGTEEGIAGLANADEEGIEPLNYL